MERLNRAFVAATIGFVLAGAPSPSLSGSAAADPGEAVGRLVGNTVEGTTADGPYALYFGRDGYLGSLDRDGPVSGRWRVEEGKLCTALPDEDEECRVVEVAGDAGSFIDSDGSRYPFTIASGNPKSL